MAMFETLARVMTLPSHTLKITCEACEYRAVFTREQAFQLFGRDAAPYDVRDYAVCTKCGERSRINVTI